MLIVDPEEIFPPILLGENLGGGTAIFAGKSGQKLQFNTLAEGLGINLSLVAGLLTISVDEGDLTYPNELSDFDDVDTTGVADNDILMYNLGGTQFEPVNKREFTRAHGTSTTIPDNTTTTLVTLDKLVTSSAIIHYSAFRESDTETEVLKDGLLFCKYRPTSDDWIISELNFHDDPNDIGLSWAISAAGAVQFTATDFDDTNYDSHMKYGFVSELAI